jgi:hypothetical protein
MYRTDEIIIEMGTDGEEAPPINGEVCDTLFYQGNGSSQTQALKYTGDKKILATTGEIMWCTGRNDLKPLNVIYRLHIGTEIADVNLRPFDSYTSYFNPIKLAGAAITWTSNWRNGFHFLPPMQGEYIDSVKFHSPVISEISIGQSSDMESHRRKYLTWLQKPDKTKGLILYGVSRGTAATFCAFAAEKYPEVRLMILEGAIDTVNDVLSHRVYNTLELEYLSPVVNRAIKSGLSFFGKYREDGPSPMRSVDEFPENVPVVFITSRADDVVPDKNTRRIAEALARKQKNDVYLLTLERSSHPNYMFDDKEDRDRYEAFIHAIYKKYGLQHDANLAEKGRDFVAAATLYIKQAEQSPLPKAS